MKNYIRIDGLPRIRFAHTFSSAFYGNVIPVPPRDCTMMEVTYIAEGTLEVSFPGDQRFTVPSHSILCNLYREPLTVQTGAHHEHHSVGFLVPFSSVGEDEKGSLCLPFLMQLPPGKGTIVSLLNEIVQAHTVHTKGETACVGLFLQLLDAIDRHARAEAKTPVYTGRIYVKKTKEYIFTHIHEPICQTDIAAHLGISPEYLCNVFKRSEGVPIMRFVNRVKLEQIRHLMETTHLTLANAAEQYGYSDPNYVSSLHRKYFNYNITDFKRSLSARAAETEPEEP